MAPPADLQKTVEIVQASWKQIVREQRLKTRNIMPILTSLGTKHVGYGVVPEHYAVVGEALIATLSDALGDAFDAETKAAWVAVYGIVQKTMIGDNYDN